MKKILVACGSGIATSTMVNNKIKNALDSNGFKGKYDLNQIKITEAARLSKTHDLLISTTQAPANLECEYISGVPFLTGVGLDKTIEKLLDFMKSE